MYLRISKLKSDKKDLERLLIIAKNEYEKLHNIMNKLNNNKSVKFSNVDEIKVFNNNEKVTSKNTIKE